MVEANAEATHNRSVSEAKPIALSSVGSSSIGNFINLIRQKSLEDVPEDYPTGLPKATASTKKRILSELRLNERYETEPDFIHFQPIGSGLQLFLGSLEGPPGTPYYGGVFHVLVLYGESYPLTPPYCRFITKTYHTNIDPEGRVCANFLGHEWSPVLTMTTFLRMICSLLDSPTAQDPLVPEIAVTYVENHNEYEETARLYTQKYAQELLPTFEEIDVRFQDILQEIGAQRTD